MARSYRPGDGLSTKSLRPPLPAKRGKGDEAHQPGRAQIEADGKQAAPVRQRLRDDGRKRAAQYAAEVERHRCPRIAHLRREKTRQPRAQRPINETHQGERQRKEQEDQEQRAAAHQRPEQQRSEEHKSELQSLMRISYAVLCLKKKKT